MKFLSVLYKIEEIEDNMAKFYKALSEKYPLNLKASSFFYKMFLEEKAHLNLVRYQKKIVWQNQNLFEDIDDSCSEKIEYALEEAKKAMAEVKQMNLRQALEKAVFLEKTVAENELNKYTRKSNIKFGIFINELAAESDSHCEKLEFFLKKIKDKEENEEFLEKIFKKAISA